MDDGASLEARIVAALQTMIAGATLLKAGRSGKPHFRQFTLTPDLQTIKWESPKKSDAAVAIADIQELVVGQSTKVFQQNPIPEHKDLSFSLIYGGGARTLDVVCKDRTEFQTWTLGIKALMQRQVTPSMVEGIAKSTAAKDRVQVVVDKRSARLVVREDASDVYTWGEGKLARLGHGEESDEYAPRVLEALLGHDVVQVAAGTAHTVAVTDAGEVFAWGDGRAGQLGQGVQRCRYTPLAIAALRGKYVKHVAAGHYHSAAISASGHLYMWGAAHNGRLGLPTTEQRVLVPTLVEERPWGDRAVVHVACGADFTVAVTDDGSVYSTGANALGQLGLGDTADRSEFTLVETLVGLDIRRVACGSGHAAAITESGQLYMWGDGTRGQLGLGEATLCAVPTPRLVEALKAFEVMDVSCGLSHTAVVVAPGTIYCFGDGSVGQLGVGTTVRVAAVPRPVALAEGRRFVMVSCGDTHTAALTDQAQVFTWGAHDNGRLGHDSTRSKLAPTLIESMVGKQVKLVACGRSFTVATVTHGWVPDKQAPDCMACKKKFTQVRRRHHCRKCGGVFCNSCSSKRFPLLEAGFTEPVRVCDKCYVILQKQ